MLNTITAQHEAGRRKTYHLGVRLDATDKAALFAVAAADRRTPADFARLVIRDAIAARRNGGSDE